MDEKEKKKKVMIKNILIALGIIGGLIVGCIILFVGFLVFVEVTGLNDSGDVKPVIYLYSDVDDKEVTVRLITDNEISCEYPEREDGVWKVHADKDGRVRDKNGQEYNYLYWEGLSDTPYDFRTGFCVKCEDSAKFLEISLAKLGLSRQEENEFIVYWLPILESNKYNLISFQTEVYNKAYGLDIEPAPDHILRVFMAVRPLDKPVDIIEQDLEAVRGSFEREGFYVVEWGGSVHNKDR